MFNQFKDLISLCLYGLASPRTQSRIKLQVEALEERSCPAGIWIWNGPAVGGNRLWSNPTGANWLWTPVAGLPGVAVAAGDYPGMNNGVRNSQFDEVEFSNPATGPATLDVQLPNDLQSLIFAGWANTLTLNQSLTVTGAGSFQLSDASTIAMANNSHLFLNTLGGANNTWTDGAITGTAGTGFNLVDSNLTIGGAPIGLGTNMFISSNVNPLTYVTLDGMTGNLPMNGGTNYIDVGAGGVLELNQVVLAGQQNLIGGIAAGGLHGPSVMVSVDPGGLLWRTGTPAAGVPDQVMLEGAIYNQGGTVQVSGGTMLNITGADTNGYSYWQDTSGLALLQVGPESNISAVGTYEIDTGTVQLTAGGTNLDRLDGQGLNFGNDNFTYLNIVDAANQTPGTVTVQGPVNMAANTTTTMNFLGGANSSVDLLDVHNGALNLDGALKLNSYNSQLLNTNINPGYFFDDVGGSASIVDSGLVITDNAGGLNDSGKVVTLNQNTVFYQVSMP